MLLPHVSCRDLLIAIEGKIASGAEVESNILDLILSDFL